MDRSPWPVHERVVEYETGWYDGGYDRVEQPDGSTKRYYWATLPPAVVVVGVDAGAVIFVKQYRPTVRQHHLELPAGIVEDDETYVDAARRELREETGFRAANATLLQEVQIATGILDHRRGYVWVDGLSAGEPDRDGNEFLEVDRVPIEEALDRARSQPANDASITGLLLAAADGYLDAAW